MRYNSTDPIINDIYPSVYDRYSNSSKDGSVFVPIDSRIFYSWKILVIELSKKAHKHYKRSENAFLLVKMGRCVHLCSLELASMYIIVLEDVEYSHKHVFVYFPFIFSTPCSSTSEGCRVSLRA